MGGEGRAVLVMASVFHAACCVSDFAAFSLFKKSCIRSR